MWVVQGVEVSRGWCLAPRWRSEGEEAKDGEGGGGREKTGGGSGGWRGRGGEGAEQRVKGERVRRLGQRLREGPFTGASRERECQTRSWKSGGG